MAKLHAKRDVALLSAIPGTGWRASGARTELLLKFSDGQFLTDDSPQKHTITAVAGANGAWTSNASGKFGHCAESVASGNGGALHGPASIVNFGAQPFTIEFWGRRSESLRTFAPFGHWSTGKLGFGIDMINFNAPRLFLSNTGTSIQATVTLSGSIPNAQFNHWAITRDAAGTVRAFVNGTLRGSAVEFGEIFWAEDVPFRIGAIGGTTSTGSRIDEFRVTKGKALYTEAFTPPGEYTA